MLNNSKSVVAVANRATDIVNSTRGLINALIGLKPHDVAFVYDLHTIKVERNHPELIVKALSEFGVSMDTFVIREGFYRYNANNEQSFEATTWYATNKHRTFVVFFSQGDLCILAKKDIQETVTMMHAKLYSLYPERDTSGRKRYSINMITGTEDNLSVSEFSVPKREYEVSPSHYLPNFPKFHSDLLNWIDSDDIGQPGLAILYGPPGTGKSTLVKSLMAHAGESGKDVFYVTPAFAESLASPNVIPLLADYSNSVMIIEDAEAILKQRQSGETNAVSTILNLTDGVLGDLMNLKIICTFNTGIDQVDPALLRPGRLFGKHYFGELPPEQVNLIKPGLAATDAMSLAEIFAS